MHDLGKCSYAAIATFEASDISRFPDSNRATGRSQLLRLAKCVEAIGRNAASASWNSVDKPANRADRGGVHPTPTQIRRPALRPLIELQDHGPWRFGRQKKQRITNCVRKHAFPAFDPASELRRRSLIAMGKYSQSNADDCLQHAMQL